LPDHPSAGVIKGKAFDAGALEVRVGRRDKMATMTALQRHSAFHFRHHFEVVSFHAVWAANGIEVGHRMIGKKS
jgi:hypothetical protein